MESIEEIIKKHNEEMRIHNEEMRIHNKEMRELEEYKEHADKAQKFVLFESNYYSCYGELAELICNEQNLASIEDIVKYDGIKDINAFKEKAMIARDKVSWNYCSDNGSIHSGDYIMYISREEFYEEWKLYKGDEPIDPIVLLADRKCNGLFDDETHWPSV